MPTIRRDGPSGPTFVRPKFRPEDYTAPAATVQLIASVKGRDIDYELDERDGSLTGYRLVEKVQRDGSTWAVVQHQGGDYCLEIELVGDDRTIGKVRGGDPKRAYDLARARDAPSVTQES